MSRALPLAASLAAAMVLALLAPAASLVGPSIARAAETDLTLVTDARYDVEPHRGRVLVTVDITARNHRAETRTHKYYFDRAYLAVLPGTNGFKITGEKGARVRVASKAKAYTMLRIDFGSRLYGGSSRSFRLTFALRDPGGASGRQTRIGSSFVSIPVWAYASDGAKGSSVAVSFPAGYAVTVESGALSEPADEADGTQVLRSGALDEPLRFFAYVVAEREPTYLDRPLSVTVGDRQADLVLRAWDDDPAWAKRIGRLFTRSLPVLGADIGLPWPLTEPLAVEEAVSRASGGYAGVFEPADARIEVAYWAEHLVVIHEAAHAWFNGALLGDRWANEGFASLYAERAALALEETGTSPELTDEVRAARVPLNAWGSSQGTARETEIYGYAASLTLARAIGERVGDETLRAVWADAAAGTGAYQPPATVPAESPSSAEPEPAAGPPDWRGLLDLLEARSGTELTDLWREWVVREEEASLLDARADARTSYSRTLALADGWALPRSIRDALRAWQFGAAESLLADARTVLAQRTALETRAEQDAVTLPASMQAAFEAGDMARASGLAKDQLNTLVSIETAEAVQPADPDPLVRIGLLGTEPESELASARTALQAGDLDAALAATDRAFRAWDGAWQEGRRRALIGIAVVATLLILASVVAARVRRSRGRTPASVEAGPRAAG